MAEIWDFVVVGSGGGGGTIAWQLAKSNFKVLLLEQGRDPAPHMSGPVSIGHAGAFDTSYHDEYGIYMNRPDRFVRLRGAYNTFTDAEDGGNNAEAFDGGWVAATLGGGSATWGGWSYRALPIDLNLATHFKSQNLGGETQLDWLSRQGYQVADWPIGYGDLAPYYRIAEALFAVGGDREAINRSIANSDWYPWLKSQPHFGSEAHWLLRSPFPKPAYPLTPVGHLVAEIMTRGGGMASAPMPASLVHPSETEQGYDTRTYLQAAINAWQQESGDPLPAFWRDGAEKLWSARRRQPCNMCGYCGGYICWGAGGPKSGTLTTTLQEFRDRDNAELRTDSFVYEIIVDPQTGRATGVRYLDISKPEHPRQEVVAARYVIVSAGAIQSARLLLMSGPGRGLGNQSDQLGRNVTFHVFGLTTEAALASRFDGLVHGELGHTGSTTSYGPYFLRDDVGVTGHPGSWWKVGTLSSTARKNPLSESGARFPKRVGRGFLDDMSKHNRAFHIRMTGDDLPHRDMRVTLDRSRVDEYGFPVARITRGFFANEKKALFPLTKSLFERMMHNFDAALDGQPVIKDRAAVKLFGDHQHGTCRMGDDPAKSVVNRNCQLHEAKNVFVVDSSFLPTGLGVPPMFTVVANALRVGTWITEQMRPGGELN